MAQRPIIVGWDGSDGGQDALALAAVLARIDGSDVIAAHTHFAPPQGYAFPSENANALRAAADAAVRGIPRHLLTGVRFEARKLEGHSAARALQELAEAEDAGLVVIGSTHHGPVGRIILGTVADRMLHGAPCPVAIAPRGYASRAPDQLRTIAVGFDGSPGASVAVTAAAKLASEAGVRLQVVAIVEPLGQTLLGDAASLLESVIHVEREWLADRVRAVRSALPSGVEAEVDLHQGEPADELLKVAASVDLLVLGSRDYGPLRRVLVGGASAGVIQNAPCPVLAIPRGTG